MSIQKIRIGITMGDPSGIGPEIIAKSLKSLDRACEYVIIGDRKVFERACQCVKLHVLKCQNVRVSGSDVRFVDLNNVNARRFSFGKTKAEYGKASIEYLDKALSLIDNQEIDCLVTCPISKEAINKAGYTYSGHTEYLQKKTHSGFVVMMLLNTKLKVSLVTRHIPLADVSKRLTKPLVTKTITLTCHALKDLFHMSNPRIVVCGINPHASDNGVIGEEENKLISPVVKSLNARYPRLEGPISSDVALAKTYSKYYDCAVAMYHDQALIALKVGDDRSGVNMTLGLPFVRTSPLHGTAFDIAGKGFAEPGSLHAALQLASRCAQNQKKA